MAEQSAGRKLRKGLACGAIGALGLIPLLTGHVFLCWRLYRMSYFMSNGGAAASLVLWAGLLQAAVVAADLLVKHFRKGDSQ